MSRPHEELLLDHLLQVVEGEVAIGADLERACGEDAEFRALCHRRVRQARALRLLTRAVAPADLAGRVVASTQGGFRQERAVGLVTDLDARPAPPALDALVRREVERPFPLTQAPPRDQAGRLLPAPAELDARVARELADLPAASARRMTSRLRRRHAPADLDRRVTGDDRRRPGLARGVGSGLNKGLAMGLLLVGILAVGGWLRSGEVHAAGSGSDRAAARAVPTLTFEVIPLSLEEARQPGHPLASLSALAGGALEGSRR